MNDTLKHILTLTAIALVIGIFAMIVRIERVEDARTPYDKFGE
jgi:hypothetical protein